eukprot:TRINITY_DN56744_c0_g1_i1.p1 TRINITY_DN56744_c0_g1~~TRINITY_DN56744_c0_g1_i1.p1  ORF type:complete len:453 (-),score=62.67 TRINITY_DN56744_c0_g1_i1:406-1764(-)
MQGGATEGLVHLRKVGEAIDCCGNQDVPSKRRKDKFVTPPMDTLKVEEEILVSPFIDDMVRKGRDLFASYLAVPVSRLHLDPTVADCVERKQRRVKEGAEFVLRLQKTLRNSVLDRFFIFWSFFAEEEFYLLTLPIMFWNVDYKFARQMNFVVCGGLLWGNLLKDVFRLPRPANVEPRVWVPHAATQIDSTACRDFGFPSTHAMNSVSNSLFAVLYYLENYGSGATALTYCSLLLCMAVWIFCISFGRLYLGVHSPMDVKGGFTLGLLIAFLAQRPVSLCDKIDALLLNTPHVGLVLLLWISTVLTLNPQPRPMTPTFMQNCVVCGLMFGAAVGFRMETDRRSSGAARGTNSIGIPLLVFRTILGYVLVLVARSLLKAILVVAFRNAGFEPSPAKPVPRDDKTKAKQQEIKGWDLWAAAVVKTTVYSCLSWTILCGAPALFELIGLPCAMSG